jgi:DNA repair exonuclease SbcCD ATPase subunit
MSRIRYLDISELNDRLSELEDKRDAVALDEESLASAKELLDAHVPPTDGTDDVDVEDLEREVEAAQDRLNASIADFGAEEEKELEKLEDLKNEIGESRGKISEDNGPFIHENDFQDYAKELAEDIGAIPNDVSWPCDCIDWEYAARELQVDYSAVEWDGVSYYYRS